MTNSRAKRQLTLAGIPIKRSHIVIAIIALLVVLLVVTNMLTASRLRAQLAAGRDQLLLRVHGELNSAAAKLNQTGGYGFADYRESIATIRRYLHAADALNSILTLNHGDNSSVFEKELYNELESALTACDRALDVGLSMDEPMEQLRGAMDRLQEATKARLDPDTLSDIMWAVM